MSVPSPDPVPRQSLSVFLIDKSRGFVLFIEVVYFLVLFALALIYFQRHAWLLRFVPEAFGPIPIGVLWFGALGSVMISVSGIFDHRKDWDESWAYWHFTRPLIGVTLAIVSVLILKAGILAVGITSPDPPKADAGGNLLYYVVAFVVGYREDVFRQLIKRVADVLLTSASRPLIVAALAPQQGKLAGGDLVTINGSGFTDASGVLFGSVAGADFAVVSDTQITVTTPPGPAGPADVVVVGKLGAVMAGQRFTYLERVA